MAELKYTYWTLVPSLAQVIGEGGRLATVGWRDAQDSVLLDGVRVTIDPWGSVLMLEPDHGDALVTLMTAFPGSTMEVLS